jgi:SAM-dependent methyltransferase
MGFGGLGLRALGKVFRDGVESVRRYGLQDLGPYLFEAVSQRVHRAERAESFDARFGTDTGDVVFPWDLPSLGASRNAEIHAYEGTSASLIREILGRLPVQTDQLAFVDLGSGKGRALLVASEFPFVEIVGVELSRELHLIAQENVRRFRPAHQRATKFRLSCMDATQYDFGTKALVLFLYNPFGRDTLRTVLANLEASLEATPRQAFLVYLNPRFEALLRSSRLTCAGRGGGWWCPWRHYVIYAAPTPGSGA